MNSKTKQILINTCKISMATITAILLSQVLGLENIFSAGIVAILSIQPTKKETLATALSRCMAFIIALIIAFISFNILGYNNQGFFLYIATFTLICQCFRWYSAIAMDSVIILHFIAFGNMSIEALINETSIFSIGILLGIIVNLHLHKDSKTITRQVGSIDLQIRNILTRMADRLLISDKSDYNGHCFLELEKSIDIAEKLAQQNFANQFGSGDVFDLKYLKMRRHQEFVLMDMYRNLRLINTTPDTSLPISDFLRKVSEGYHRDNNVNELLSDLKNLQEQMKQTTLPKEREEFENRAKLYVLMQQLHEFLAIKHVFKTNKELQE